MKSHLYIIGLFLLSLVSCGCPKDTPEAKPLPLTVIPPVPSSSQKLPEHPSVEDPSVEDPSAENPLEDKKPVINWRFSSEEETATIVDVAEPCLFVFFPSNNDERNFLLKTALTDPKVIDKVNKTFFSIIWDEPDYKREDYFGIPKEQAALLLVPKVETGDEPTLLFSPHHKDGKPLGSAEEIKNQLLISLSQSLFSSCEKAMTGVHAPLKNGKHK